MSASALSVAGGATRLVLTAGDYRLVLVPSIGGAIASFVWRGAPVFREMVGAGVIDAACFPLVPFSNRIAHGQFCVNGHEVRLAPNFPGGADIHPLHGFGWLARWEIAERAADFARVAHRYEPGEWPWPYIAEQEFALDADGLTMRLRVCNLAHSPMPAGLGFHPYFPRTCRTRYHGLHREQWITGLDGLPIGLEQGEVPRDWWRGRPVSTRIVDTVYGGRHGPLTIVDTDRGQIVTLAPTDNLTCTALYVPANEPFFCVEPVSHPTDRFNTVGGTGDFVCLPSGASMAVGLRISVRTC